MKEDRHIQIGEKTNGGHIHGHVSNTCFTNSYTATQNAPAVFSLQFALVYLINTGHIFSDDINITEQQNNISKPPFCLATSHLQNNMSKSPFCLAPSHL